MEKLLQVKGLEKVYGTNKGNALRAVAGVSFDIEKGEFVSIMGPSGSGKTTLVNCISTIDRPTSGEVLLEGKSIWGMKNKELAKFRSQSLGFIFQESNLLDTLTCQENIALPLTIARHNPAEIKKRVEDKARYLGIESILNSFPYQVSGGQAQRVSAARALIANPSLVIADEPTGALDSKNSATLLESLTKINQEDMATILMVTHDVFAASWSHRVLFLRDGRLYTQLVKGDMSRSQFFQEIMSVVGVIGGGSDVIR